jgi:hypothetical protein
MVPVARVSHGFEARVLVARLGSEGIVTQVRGSLDGPYPVGAVEVLVEEDQLVAAREILTAGPVEDGDGWDADPHDRAAPDGPDDPGGGGWRTDPPDGAGTDAASPPDVPVLAARRRRMAPLLLVVVLVPLAAALVALAAAALG